MQSKRHPSRRGHQVEAAAAARPAAPVIEMLEARQLMSAAPLAAPLGTLPAGPATHAPLVAAKAAVTAVVSGNGTAGTGGGGTSTGGPVASPDSIWGKIKGAAKWAKDHIVLGLNSIGIKGKF